MHVWGLTMSSLADWVVKAYLRHRKHGKRRYKAKPRAKISVASIGYSSRN